VIAAAEAEGFRSARMKAQGRNNSEVFLRLPAVSQAILARLGGRVSGAGVGFDVVAMTSGLECYRYEEGDSIAAHHDASEEISTGLHSDLSLVLYLTEAFQGGETCFPDQALRLRPGLGGGVLFRHSLLHEGGAVWQGRKYVIRTSVAAARSDAARD